MNQTFDLSQILNSLERRKELIIAVSFVVITLATYLAISLPDVYRSSTLILVTPQRLPSNYVASTVTSTIEQRMQAIAQQVLGRTMLEKVVQEFNLFQSEGFPETIDGRVTMLRKRITLAINRNDTFTLSFDAESPENARRVTARIASLFIEENVKVREQQAAGTTTFINAEAERLRKELEEQEAEINKFRAQYWQELPENRDANFTALERLRGELENSVTRLATLQDRKAGVEKQLAEGEVIATELTILGSASSAQVPSATTGNLSRTIELEALLNKYSERHPDVVRLKREIEASRFETPTKQSQKTLSDPSLATRFTLKTMLASQIGELKNEITSLQTRIENLRPQISLLRSRVDNTPLRAIEISKITRNYDITLRKYQDLLAKALESELSENMERKQKGEQFQIVDRANIPQQPVAPNRARIIIVGIVLGIGAGVGAVFLLELLNTSFKRTEDLQGFTTIPLLATLPMITTRGQAMAQRQERSVLIVASAATLAVGLFLVPIIVRSPLFF